MGIVSQWNANRGFGFINFDSEDTRVAKARCRWGDNATAVVPIALFTDSIVCATSSRAVSDAHAHAHTHVHMHMHVHTHTCACPRVHVSTCVCV